MLRIVFEDGAPAEHDVSACPGSLGSLERHLFAHPVVVAAAGQLASRDSLAVAVPGEVQVGLDPDDGVEKFPEGSTAGAHPFDDYQRGVSRDADVARTVRGPARGAVGHGFAATKWLDDCRAEQAVPTEPRVTPGNVVGVNDLGTRDHGGDPLGECGLPVRAPAVDRNDRRSWLGGGSNQPLDERPQLDDPCLIRSWLTGM